MIKTSTHSIEIAVEVKYWPHQSIPCENHYFFIYFITITNNSRYTVQLLKRHWDIFDTETEHRVVEGEGVVGETPTLEPGEKFEYNSGCNLTTDMGYMRGYYTMKRLIDDSEFEVKIPRFEMIVPGKNN